MELIYSAERILRILSLLCAGFFFLSNPLLAQTPEPDQTTSSSAAGSGGRDTSHHEAGSVEASAPAMRDRIFLRQAVTNGMLELRLSELAEQKASGEDVKAFATHLVADHRTLDDDLRAAAESQGVMLPTKLPSREQTVYERLNGLSGEEFDRQYVKRIVEDQRRDLREFRAEAASTPDESLRTKVQNGAKLIHHHMVAADQIARNKGLESAHPAKVEASNLSK